MCIPVCDWDPVVWSTPSINDVVRLPSNDDPEPIRNTLSNENFTLDLVEKNGGIISTITKTVPQVTAPATNTLTLKNCTFEADQTYYFQLSTNTGTAVIVGVVRVNFIQLDASSLTPYRSGQFYDTVYNTPVGPQTKVTSDSHEFYDGEFDGSTLITSTQSLNPNNPYKFANTTQLLYDITSSATTIPIGYDITNPDVGQLNFEILRQVGPKGGFYNCTQIWINETDKNNLDISTPLDNLSAGDTFTFTGQFQLESNTLPPITLNYTRTFTGIISSVTTVNSDVYNIQFDPPAASGVGDGDGSFTNVNSRILVNQNPQLDPYINAPNFAYSDFNALINNDLIARRSNIFWDVDYNSNAIQAVNQQSLITASQQDGDLPKAFIQDYNYYSTPITTRNYKGSKNTVASFNTGSGYNSQYSVGTYVAYYSRLIATGGGPYTGTMIIEYIISPDGTLIEAINNEDNLELLKQNFVNNEFSEGQIQMIATPFSSSDTIQVDFTERLEAKSFAKLQLTGKRTGNAYVNDNIGGIVYPAGIEFSSAKDLPQTARQILSDNRII